MRLENMRINVLSLTHEALVASVEEARIKRVNDIQSMSNFDFDGEKPAKRKTGVPVLSAEEKAILKSLGLTAKDLKAMRQ
jgi:phage I-like protein